MRWLIVRECTAYPDDLVLEALENLGLDSSRCLWSSSHDSDGMLMTSASSEVGLLQWCPADACHSHSAMSELVCLFLLHSC